VNTFSEYSEIARQSDVYPKMDRQVAVAIPGSNLPFRYTERLPVYPALALGGEAGEFSEKVKKAWRDGTPLNTEEAAKELGDVLWYVDAAAKDMGYTLQQIAQMNLDKIQSRRARGVLGGSGDNR